MNMPHSTALSERASAYAWFVTVVLTCAMVLSLVDRMVISLLVVPIQEDIGLVDTEIGWIIGVAFGLFYSVMGLPLGWMVDRFHRVRLIAAGIALWSVMTILSGLADSFWELFLARVGVGIGEAVLAPAGWSLLSDILPPQQRARGLSLFQFGAISGTGLGLILGGWIYGISASAAFSSFALLEGLAPWRAVFVVAATLSVPILLLMAFVTEPRQAQRTGRALATKAPLLDAWRFLTGHARVLPLLFLAMGGIILMIYSVSSWTPTIVAREFGLPPGTVGTSLGSVILCGGLAGVISGGWLTDLFVKRNKRDIYVNIMLVSVVGAVPCVLAIAGAASYAMLLAAVGVFFFFACLPNGVLVAYIQSATPPAMRGLISAVYVLTVNIVGYLLGPPGVALISRYVTNNDLAQGLALLSVVLGSASFALFLGSRKAANRLIAA